MNNTRPRAVIREAHILEPDRTRGDESRPAISVCRALSAAEVGSKLAQSSEKMQKPALREPDGRRPDCHAMARLFSDGIHQQSPSGLVLARAGQIQCEHSHGTGSRPSPGCAVRGEHHDTATPVDIRTIIKVIPESQPVRISGELWRCVCMRVAGEGKEYRVNGDKSVSRW